MSLGSYRAVSGRLAYGKAVRLDAVTIYFPCTRTTANRTPLHSSDLNTADGWKPLCDPPRPITAGANEARLGNNLWKPSNESFVCVGKYMGTETQMSRPECSYRLYCCPPEWPMELSRPRHVSIRVIWPQRKYLRRTEMAAFGHHISDLI